MGRRRKVKDNASQHFACARAKDLSLSLSLYKIQSYNASDIEGLTRLFARAHMYKHAHAHTCTHERTHTHTHKRHVLYTGLLTHVLIALVAAAVPSRANGSATPAHPTNTARALWTARSTPGAPLVLNFSHPENNASAFGSAAASSNSSSGTVGSASVAPVGAPATSASARNLQWECVCISPCVRVRVCAGVRARGVHQ